MALSKIQAESMNLADTYAFTGTVSGAGEGVGDGQSYSTPSRSVNVTYTNSTGKPIFVIVNIDASNQSIQSGLKVDGNPVDFKGFEGGGLYSYMFKAIVPNGSTYEFDANSGYNSVLFWRELS